MMLADAIFQRLSGYAGLSALVVARIYPSRAPDGAVRPYVVYLCFDANDLTEDLDGVGDLVQSRVQTEAWDLTPIGADRVGDQVRLALNNFTGTVAGVEIAQITVESGFPDRSEEHTSELQSLMRLS